MRAIHIIAVATVNVATAGAQDMFYRGGGNAYDSTSPCPRSGAPQTVWLNGAATLRNLDIAGQAHGPDHSLDLGLRTRADVRGPVTLRFAAESDAPASVSGIKLFGDGLGGLMQTQ